MNQRPTGVTILAILAFIGGVLSILAGLALVGLGGVFAAAGGGLAILFGIYALVWGALALWIGWGFWQLRPSAWRWGVILMAVGVVIARKQKVPMSALLEINGATPERDRKSTRLNSSHVVTSRMPSSA